MSSLRADTAQKLRINTSAGKDGIKFGDRVSSAKAPDRDHRSRTNLVHDVGEFVLPVKHRNRNTHGAHSKYGQMERQGVRQVGKLPQDAIAWSYACAREQ